MMLRWLLAAFAIASMSTAVPVLAGNHADGDLPPGLEKKVERGGELPPGWQKKVRVGEPLDRDIYEAGVVVADGERLLTVRIEGKLVRLVEETREVVEVLD